MNRKVKLGRKYTDPLTGFTGTATARTEYLYGCVRVGLEGTGEGSVPEEHWFDEQRLVEAATSRDTESTATAGGGRKAPPKRRTR